MFFCLISKGLLSLFSVFSHKTLIFNFIHIVFDDGVYYTTGSQPIPGKDKYDFKSIATGSGIEKSYSFDDLETFSAEFKLLLNEDGPIFISLKIEHKKSLMDAWVGNTKENSRKIKKYLYLQDKN